MHYTTQKYLYSFSSQLVFEVWREEISLYKNYSEMNINLVGYIEV